MTERRVVLAVDEYTTALVADDRVLADALEDAGFAVEARVWGTPLGDLAPTDALVVRSTWDYTERVGEFANWLDVLALAPFIVANPPAVMRWNMHKGYLAELAAAGIPVVPTELVPRRDSCVDAIDLGALASTMGWADVVVKPAISATARGAIRGEPDELQAHLNQLTLTDDVLVQPLIASVVAEGEWSIVIIDGVVTSAVRKQAQPGEWRVQSDFGGTYERVSVTSEMVTFATNCLAAIGHVTPAPTTYARVDVVRHNGHLALIEAELIEPDLFFGLADETVEAMVSALVRAATLAP